MRPQVPSLCLVQNKKESAWTVITWGKQPTGSPGKRGWAPKPGRAGAALTSGVQVQLALLAPAAAAQVGRSAVMVLYNELPLAGVICFPRQLPSDPLVLKGTRDCHRGARNLHQELPLGKETKGTTQLFLSIFLLSYSLYIPLNNKEILILEFTYPPALHLQTENKEC